MGEFLSKIIIYLEFISLLIFITALLLRYSERNRAQISLVIVLVAWISIFAARLIPAMAGLDDLSVVQQMKAPALNFATLIGGLVAFVSLCIYPVLVIDPKLLRSKAALITITPISIGFISYIIYHAAVGLPINEAYSLEDLWAARDSVTIIWRFVIVLLFIFTITFSSVSIWSIIPSYESFIQKNYADPNYNIMWIRTFIIGILSISVVFFTLLFYNTSASVAIYAIVTGATFAIIADNAIKQKAAGLPDGFDVKWEFGKGWYCIHHEVDSTNDLELPADIYDRFIEWIEQERPYLASDFSASRVKDRFPELTYSKLNTLLQRDSYTFQSYIRKCRIDEAVRLIESNDRLNYKEIGYMVGFSHYPSFCRAFTAERGVSPTSYPTEQRVD